MPSDEPIQQQLEIARRDLLDLSTRNRLLSTPRDAARSSSVEIKDEVSAEIYRMLVEEKSTMQFEQGELVDDEEAGAKKRRTTKTKVAKEAKAKATEPVDLTKDSILHTELEPDELDSRLLSLVSDASASLEEKGVNVLYLALGFLRWREADSDKLHDAPLLLIPVELRRNQGGVRYSLAFVEEDIETNLTLKVRLKVDFGIDLPNVPEVDNLTPTVYFQDVEQAIASQAEWEVRADDIVLWFFSFNKLLMYRDLDPASWQSSQPLESRSLIKALLQDGFPPVEPLCSEAGRIDVLFDPAQTAHVIDCDSSQALVIEEACRGRSLVIQGPPGTGKSQTITNLITAAVHSGKTILFVAEKMAALEVVKRRLDNIGLGDMCLELHSKMASKSTVVNEIDRTLKLGAPQNPPELTQTIKRLREVRDQLNLHVDRMHQPLEPSGKTVYEILSDLIELRAAGTQLPDIQLAEAAKWTQAEFSERVSAVTDLSQVIAHLGDPATHPWRGCQLEQILPLDLERLLVAIPSRLDALKALTMAADQLAQRLGDDPPITLDAVARLQRTADALLAAPQLDPQPMNGVMWSDNRQVVKELADSGRAINTARESLKDKVNDAAWETDVAAAHLAYATYGQSWFRMFRSSYRAARRTLKSCLAGGQPKTFEERLRVLELLNNYRKAKQTISEDDAMGQKAFGQFWLSNKTDWPRIAAWENWDEKTAAADVSPRFRQMLSLLDKPEEIRILLGNVELRLRTFLTSFTELCQTLKIEFDKAFGPAQATTIPVVPLKQVGPVAQTPLEELRKRLEAWKQDPEGLQHWQTYRRSRATVAEIADGAVIKRIESGQVSADQSPNFFRFAVAESLLRAAFIQFPELESFNRDKFEQLIGEFSKLDIRRLELARVEVAGVHWSRIGKEKKNEVATPMPEAVSILKHEMQKKRRHLPLRQLLKLSGPAIQSVKPVFMMSPLSVAQYLEPGALEFDMLLIDEASQVRPVEALGAAARCRQMVVVGDDKQMPPTQFFGTVVGDVDLGDDESLDMQAGDVESILGLCIARNMPQRMLRWHYRSKHESLIAVSNEEFYDSQLFVIPSPVHEGELGVKFHFIEDGKFIKGVNKIEAKRVAESIMKHAAERPTWTLGVGAFSVSQRDAIIKELEELRKADPQHESFFDPNAPDPFFVKNLENIQGDERDVIFVSVGYGPGEDGKVSLNFGPVSASGGERRLNVLMTRAKRICAMFASMHAEDIDVNRVSGRGPVVFRSYLKFAQLGGKADSATSSQSHDRLVGVLQSQLQDRGYEVETNVGIAGVFVDLAVADPKQPGSYLLGIDVDGPSYHAGRSARDRDRTRSGVLSGQGWNLVRVWSLDWFSRPTEELKKLIEAVETAKRGKFPRGGPALASTVSEVRRQSGGLDPLSAAVGPIQPIPDRPANETGTHSPYGDIVAGFTKAVVKGGIAAMTAEKGKATEAFIKGATSGSSDNKKKKA